MATVPYPSAATYPPQIHHHHAFPLGFSPAYAPTPLPAYAPASIPAAATHSSSPYFSAPPRFPSTYPAPASGSFPAALYGSPSYPYAATYPCSPPASVYGPSTSPSAATFYPTAFGSELPGATPSYHAYPYPYPPCASAPPIPPAEYTTVDCYIHSRPHLYSPSDSLLKPLPVSASSEFSGELSIWSPLGSRSRLQQLKEGGYETEEDDGATPRCDRTFSSKAVQFAMPKFRCRGRDLTKGTNTSGASVNGKRLVHKQPGPEILSMADNYSKPQQHSQVCNTATNQQYSQASAPALLESAEAQARAEETISKNMPCVVLDLKRRLDAQQARDRTSFDTIKGELARLSSMAAQLAVSIGKQSSAAASLFVSSPSSPLGASFVEPAAIIASTTATSASMLPAAPAYVAPQVFDKMATPSSGHGTQATTPNYCDGHQTPIQSTSVPARNDNLIEHNVDGMLQAYGLHNLNCRTMVRADSTEHNYYALPENYPLERTMPEPLFSDESVGVFASNPGQQPYEEEHQEGDRLLKCSSKALETDHTGACLIITSDVRNFTLELQHKDDERACGCPVIKASDSTVSSSNQLSIDHSMIELRLLWDPGASSFFVIPLNNGSSNDTIGNEHVGRLVSSTSGFSSHDTDLWSQSELRGVFEEVMLDKPQAKPPDRYGIADSSLQVSLVKVHKVENSSAHTHLNFLICNSKQLSDIQTIQCNCFSLEAIPSWQGGAFSLGNFAISVFWRTATPGILLLSDISVFSLGHIAAVPVLVAPHSKVTYLAKNSLIVLFQDTHEQEQLPKENEQTSTYCSKASENTLERKPVYDVFGCALEQHQQLYEDDRLINDFEKRHEDKKSSMEKSDAKILFTCPKKAPVDSSMDVLLWSQCPVLADLQYQLLSSNVWDPGIGASSSMYHWLQTLTAANETKTSNMATSSDQCFVCMDTGTILLLYTYCS